MVIRRALKFDFRAASCGLSSKQPSLQPDIHQPASVDSSKASAHHLRHSSVGEHARDVLSEGDPFAQNWQNAQKALVARWPALTPGDVAAANGDHERFVERLASWGGVSQFEAANDFTAFESSSDNSLASRRVGLKIDTVMISSNQNSLDGAKALREALSEVDPKALAKALEDVTAGSKRKVRQFGEQETSSDDAQQH